MHKIILLLTFTLCFSDVWAQEFSSEKPVFNTPQWQMTLDIIKTKAEVLMKKNNILLGEKESLLKEFKGQQQTILDWKTKNEALQQFLKERRGRSDEQMKIDELAEQIKQKRSQLSNLQYELELANAQIQGTEQKMQLKKLKIADLQLLRNQDNLQAGMQEAFRQKDASQDDDEMISLKQQLQEHRNQEKVLTEKLEELKAQKKTIVEEPKQVVDEGQIKALQEKFDVLLKQKEDLQKRLSSDNKEINLQRYQQLMSRKSQLEDKIKAFEAQLNQLKQSPDSVLATGQSNKDLVKQIAAIDNRNAQLRQTVAGFRENVTVLKTQVKRLERKVSVQRKILEKT